MAEIPRFWNVATLPEFLQFSSDRFPQNLKLVATSTWLAVILFPIVCLLGHHLQRNSLFQRNNIDSLRRKREFMERNADSYGYRTTVPIDSWRSTELPQLILPLQQHHLLFGNLSSWFSQMNGLKKTKDDQRIVYLDYAGAALPVRSQLAAAMVSPVVLANPHSMGPAASLTQACIEEVTSRILQHFQAQPQRIVTASKSKQLSHTNGESSAAKRQQQHPGYDLIYTSGTTEALRTVAERFFLPQQCASKCNRKSVFVYTANCHTSVVGMRQLASDFRCVATNTGTTSEAIIEMIRRVDVEQNVDDAASCDCCCCPNKNLLALPLECNLTGAYYNYDPVWREIQKSNSRKKRWYVLLDIAKAAATGPVNLAQLNPDFACLSFYKLFGEPTGLGCLLVKRTSMHALVDIGETIDHKSASTRNNSRQVRHYFGGGSVDVIFAGQDFAVPRTEVVSSLQHGTIHFRGIVALQYGFEELERVGGMAAIQQHTRCLGQEFIRRLRHLKHANGRDVIKFYFGKSSNDAQQKEQQSTVAFHVKRADGSYVGYNEVAKLAAMNNPPIQLRTGCMCNPGACQLALGLSDEDILRNYEETGHVCGDEVDIIRGRPTGVVRVSFGKDSIWEDLDACVLFFQRMFVMQDDGEDENDLIHMDAKSSGESPIAKVIELYIYPIKSCGAQRVQCWEIEKTNGRLAFDREFALVDASGRALRLQSYPKMNLLKPQILLAERQMKILAPGQSPLFIPLDRRASHRETVQICGDSCDGTIIGDAKVSEWFSTFLGVKCWLARHVEKGSGMLSKSVRSKQVAFANERPLLLISQQAVDLLNSVLKEAGHAPVQSLHFRPNLVITVLDDSGINNDEDGWKRLSRQTSGGIADLKMDVAGPCARCSMVDFHPDNGRRGKTLQALAKYRRANGQINFGIFLHVSPNKEFSRWNSIMEGDTFLCSTS